MRASHLFGTLLTFSTWRIRVLVANATAAYAAEVLNAFITNVPAMKDACNQLLESETSRSSSNELEEDLRLLKGGCLSCSFSN
ncbi:hypothetical protein FJT64_012437 [Amphibalanus amphitrite]|uniref:Uncharacterized protein n=1 Tax=Amphibalanus amphitrite TaxID=1232801 RepID=A0A6A4VDB5_AMPAM|nr:hypothetical protein FJT64_012437 [Amphibalanus amphitrite]